MLVEIFKTRGFEFKVVADSWQNYRSWGHKAVLKFGYQEFSEKITYYNRTWERYQYESVVHSVIYKVKKWYEDFYLEQFKKKNNIKRLGKKGKEMFKEFIEDKEIFPSLEDLQKYIDDNH